MLYLSQPIIDVALGPYKPTQSLESGELSGNFGDMDGFYKVQLGFQVGSALLIKQRWWESQLNPGYNHPKNSSSSVKWAHTLIELCCSSIGS